MKVQRDDSSPIGSSHALVLLLAGLLATMFAMRFAALFAFPLLDPTESRYSRIAMEMDKLHDWIVPHLRENRPFWGKPPLSFWLTALSFRAFGIHDFSARLPSYLSCLAATGLTCLLAYRLRQRLGPTTDKSSCRAFALFCGAILTSTFLFNASAGFVQTDSVLLLVATLCFLSIPMARLATGPIESLCWRYAFFVGLGLALLAKGPVALAVTVLALAVWCLGKQARREVRAMPWITGLMLTTIIAVPWYIEAERHSPGFLRYYLIGEHWMRFLRPGWKSLYGTSHQLPPGTIWAMALLAVMPWVLLWAWNMIRRRNTESSLLALGEWKSYLAAWILAPLILFSPARNIMMTYVLTGIPAFAILCGWALWRYIDPNSIGTDGLTTRRIRIAIMAGLLIVPFGFAIASFTYLPRAAREISQKALIDAYCAVRGSGRGKLIYYGEAPDSAAIYGGDSIEEMEIKSSDKLRDADAEKPACFAVTWHDESKFLRRDPEATVQVGVFGDYALRKLIK